MRINKLSTRLINAIIAIITAFLIQLVLRLLLFLVTIENFDMSLMLDLAKKTFL